MKTGNLLMVMMVIVTAMGTFRGGNQFIFGTGMGVPEGPNVAHSTEWSL